MHGIRRSFGFVSFFCLLAAVPVPAQGGIDALLAEYPAQSPEKGAALAQQLLDMGPEAIAAVCGRLVPAGGGDDNAARYALNGAAFYASQSSTEEDRLVLIDALLAALDAGKNTEVRAFLIEQLRLAGRNECVTPLSRYLSDEALCDPASRALASIGTPQAGQALLDALAAAEGAPRLSLVNALSAMTYAPAAAALTALAASEDALLRLAASDALARLAPADAVEQLLAKTRETDLTFRIQAMSRCLVYAERRAAQGDAASCVRICEDLLARAESDVPEHIVCGAFTNLAQTDPARASDAAVRLMMSSRRSVRSAVLQAAASVPGVEITQRWCEVSKAVQPEVRSEIIAMLGKRGDRPARNALIEALNDGDAAVRLAAIEGLPGFGGPRVVEALLECLQRASEKDEMRALEDALLRFSADQLGRRVAASLQRVSPEARKTLLEILAARRVTEQADAVFHCVQDADEAVRLAAIEALAEVALPEDTERVLQVLLNAADGKECNTAIQSLAAVALQVEDTEARLNPLLTAMEAASGAAKGRILSVLPHVDGGRQALDAVVTATQDADAAVKQTALQALADWKLVQALNPILDACKANATPETCDMLLRGYARIVRESDRSDGKKLQLLDNATAVAGTTEQKRILMNAVRQFRTVGALRMLEGFLNEPALQADAAAAMAQMACPQDEKDTGLRAYAVARALTKALPFLADEGLRGKAQQHIAAMPLPDAEGFVPLFNGADLTGWTGDLAGYAAQDGTLVCKATSHANLYTDCDYTDFVLRLEFRLAPAANNGIGLRTPLYGHAAYEGLEVQVLDDSAPQHADLKPHQYHGSLYGLVAAKRRYLKPAGEWNEQEISAQGTHIVIKLNGATILDTDLEQFRTVAAPDGKEHPGLFNKSGRIAFLGHGAQVEYRNIRIKELE